MKRKEERFQGRQLRKKNDDARRTKIPRGEWWFRKKNDDSKKRMIPREERQFREKNDDSERITTIARRQRWFVWDNNRPNWRMNTLQRRRFKGQGNRKCTVINKANISIWIVIGNCCLIIVIIDLIFVQHGDMLITEGEGCCGKVCWRQISCWLNQLGMAYCSCLSFTSLLYSYRD